MSLWDENGGGEFSGGQFIAVFPDTNAWGDANWKNVTCDLVGSSTWSVTSFKVARLPFRVSADGTDHAFRYVLIGVVPGGVSGSWTVRVTSGGVSMTTTNNALDAGAMTGSLSYASNTYTHDPDGSGVFQLLGIWADGTNIPKLGWKAIPGGSGTTSETDGLFRPTGMTGKPAYAVCVQVPDVNASDNAKNCWFIRMASLVVV